MVNPNTVCHRRRAKPPQPLEVVQEDSALAQPLEHLKSCENGACFLVIFGGSKAPQEFFDLELPEIFTSSLCLCGDQIEVLWLTPIIKQELHNVSVPGNLKALPSSWSCRSVLPQVSSRPIDCHMLPARASVLDHLKLQCKLHQLGPPVIFTKCVQRNPEDWLQFWYQVVIPKYPSPFSGFIWIKPDPSGLEDHEKVKNFVALQLLKVLGYPVM